MSGAEFRAARKSLGWSATSLADRLGITRQTVWALESAEAVRPLYVLAIRGLIKEQADRLAAA